MYKVEWPKIEVKPITIEKKEKIDKCIEESNLLIFRPVYCLACETHLIDIAEDICGHIAVKCQKCKAIFPINSAYFKRSDYMAMVKKRNEFVVPLRKTIN